MPTLSEHETFIQVISDVVTEVSTNISDQFDEEPIYSSRRSRQDLSALVFDPSTLIANYISKHNNKSDSFNLREFLKTFPDDMCDKLWSAIYMNVDMLQKKSSFKLLTELYIQREETSKMNNKEEVQVIKKRISEIEDELSFLDCAVLMCSEFIAAKTGTESGKSKKKNLEQTTSTAPVRRTILTFTDFLDTVSILHDLLLIIGTSEQGNTIQSKICACCEQLYQLYPDEESVHEFVPNTIVYLLSDSLLLGAKQSSIKRVYAMRKALELLDYSEATTLQELLLRTVISPLYLSTPDGIKFITFAMNLDPSLPSMFHSAITPQIPTATESIVSAYGEVYYKSWKNAQGQSLLNIEHSCIQDLMYHAIHARHPSLFDNLRIILNTFHAQKNQKGVDEMLLRLYEPILFRCLSVANAAVRRNASCLLIDSFPLRNPENNREESDTLFQKQLEHLKDLMMDECPAVRIVAVEGICRILTLYWEAITSDDSYYFLKQLITKLAYDANSVNVRVSACKGVAYLLDNPLSQPVLKKLLPKLGRLINDNTATVRSSLISLLMRVKAVRSISFDAIVSEDSLLDRIVVDSESIKKHIASLLLNSYFPYNRPPSEILERLLFLVHKNPNAAKEFYKHVLDSVPDHAPAKLIKTVNKFVRKCIQTIKFLNSEAEYEEDGESQMRPISESEANEFKDVAKDLILMGDVIEILANTFEYMVHNVHDEDSLQFLRQEFAGTHLRDINTKFPTLHVSSCVWAIAKCLPQDHMTIMAHDSLGKLERMCSSGSLRTDYQYIVDCTIEWEFEDKVLSMIEHYIDISRTHYESTYVQDQHTKRRKVTSQVEIPLRQRLKQALVALALLHSLLESPKACRYLLLKAKKQLNSIASILSYQVSTELPTGLRENCKNVDDTDLEQYSTYLSTLFHSYLKLITHKILKPVKTNKFKNKKRAEQDELLQQLFDETPTELIDFLSLFNEVLAPAMQVAACDDSNLVTPDQLVIQSRRNETVNTHQIVFYPAATCICKSMCIYLSEWLMLGMIRIPPDSSDDEGAELSITDKIRNLFEILMGEDLRPILPYVIPDVLKALFMIYQNQTMNKLSVEILVQLLFTAPEYFISSQCPPLIPISMGDDDDEIETITRYPRTVRSKIEQLVNHRRGYVQRILLAIVCDNKRTVHTAQVMLQHCFSALQDHYQQQGEDKTLSEQEQGIQTPSSIHLCLSLLHELTWNKGSNKKDGINCITAFASEFCNWLRRTCNSLLELTGSELEELEMVLCLILDLAGIILRCFEGFWKRKQQNFMKRLLMKTALEIHETLSVSGEHCQQEDTINRMNTVLQQCQKLRPVDSD